MKKLRAFFFRFFIILLLVSCYKEPEMLQIDQVKINKVVNDTMYLNVVANIFNPNSFTIEAKNIKLKFSIEDTLAGKGKIKSNFSIKPNSSEKINLSTKLLLPALSDKLPRILKKDSFPVKVFIEADVTSLEIPLSTQTVQYFKSKEMINSFLSGKDFNNNISIDKIELVSSSLDSTEIKFDMLFVNTLPFDYKVKSIKSKIYNNEDKDELMGTSKMTKSVVIKKDKKKIISFQAKINNLNSIKGLFKNLLNKKTNVFLHSDVLIDINKYSFKIPFETTFEMPKPNIF